MSNEQNAVNEQRSMTAAEAASLATATADGIRKIAAEAVRTFPQSEEALRASEHLVGAAVYLENLANRITAETNSSPA